MLEMEGAEPNPLSDLLSAIREDSLEKVEKSLSNLADVELNEGYISAAETIGNPEIIESVVEHIIVNGLNPPHDFPTQLHWAISRGFRHSAAYLAEIAMEQDLAERDNNGKTPLDLARERHYSEVAAVLESAGNEQ